jgi:hypothetical protein
LAAKYDLAPANATQRLGLQDWSADILPRILRSTAVFPSLAMRILSVSLAAATAFVILCPSLCRAQSGPDTMRLPRPAALSQLAFVKATACLAPFGMRAGQQIEYQVLDGKGKLAGTWRYRVVTIKTDSISGKKNKVVTTTKVLLKSGHYSASNQLLAQQDLTHYCRNDSVFTDGMAVINYESLKSFRNRLLAYQTTGLPWPNVPTTGSTLPQGGVSIQVSSPTVAIAKIRTVVQQRKVLAGPVKVKVPAGTYTCYVVEGQRETSTTARPDMVFKSSGKEVTYYDPSVGIVKTELYDKRGKLLQSKVLLKR